VMEAMDWEALALLPAADGRDVTAQIGGDFLPSFQASRPGVGVALGVGYGLDRHRQVGSCYVEEVLHRFVPVATV